MKTDLKDFLELSREMALSIAELNLLLEKTELDLKNLAIADK